MADKTPQNPFLDMFRKFGADLKLPAPEVGDILDFHRRNLQALQEAAQISSAGAQSIMDRQRKALEEALAEITEMIQSGGKSGDPAAAMTGRTEFARKYFEGAVKNATEIGEIMRESGGQSLEVLKGRIEQSLEELGGRKP